mmetsp:Transcript_67348/g.210655  ORF Transcript_67348/g.210655 Transcript_67348/m.210655 type:complete len:547 (-) Transcript_67348:157-1797(-)
MTSRSSCCNSREASIGAYTRPPRTRSTPCRVSTRATLCRGNLGSCCWTARWSQATYSTFRVALSTTVSHRARAARAPKGLGASATTSRSPPTRRRRGVTSWRRPCCPPSGVPLARASTSGQVCRWVSWATWDPGTIAKQPAVPRLRTAALLAATAALLGSRRGFVAVRGAAAGGARLRLAGAPEQPKARGPPPMRLGPGVGSDPVNNVSPEMSAAGRKYAQKYEDVFLSGKRLWDAMKREGKPKKIYFIGTNGNTGDEIAESVLDSLAYIPAPDGTMFIHRKPGVKYPKIKYTMWVTDKKVAERAKIAPADLYMEDEQEYRDIEAGVLKEFSELEDNGYPFGCVVGESAMLRPENVEIMKQGLVIWLDADTEYTWAKTQYRPQQGGGLYIPPDYQARPPVWAIANGWDGDVDDTEGKLEYAAIVEKHNKMYEEIADIRLRTDIPGITENSYWGAGRICKALTEYLGLANEEDASVEDEVMERDLEKFLEGARLSKYIKPALKWCDEQGAASIEDVVDNVPDFSEALKLKPLERKRLEKAAASVATG